MRTMNDTERIVLITKVLLYCKGPLSVHQLLNEIQKVPVRMTKGLSINILVGTLRGKNGIKRDRQTKLYSVVQ